MDTKLLILILNGLTQAAIFFVLGSGLSIALFGFLFEPTMLFGVRGGDLPETLLTVALFMIIADVSLATFLENLELPQKYLGV